MMNFLPRMCRLIGCLRSARITRRILVSASDEVVDYDECVCDLCIYTFMECAFASNSDQNEDGDEDVCNFLHLEFHGMCFCLQF